MSIIKVLIYLIPVLFILNARSKFTKQKKKVETVFGKQNSHEALTQIIEKNPKSHLGYYYKAYALWQEGEPEEALKLLLEAENKTKPSEGLLTLIAEIYLDLSNVNLATAYYQKALKVNKTAYVNTRLGEIHSQIRDYDSAVDYYQKALKCPNAAKGFIYSRLENAYIYMGEDTKRDQCQRKASKHSDASFNRLTYNFNPDVFNPKFTSKKKTHPVVWTLVVFIVIIGLLTPALSEDESSSIVDDSQITVEKIDTTAPDENEIKADEVNFETQDNTNLIFVEDYGIEYDYSNMGNTNSNIQYNSFAAEYKDPDYEGKLFVVYADGIHIFDVETDTSKLWHEVDSATHLNVINDTIFYITNWGQGEKTELHMKSLDESTKITYSGDNLSNLIVDQDNFYYTGFAAGEPFLYVNSYQDQNSFAFQVEDINYLCQNDTDLIYLSNQIIYRVNKSDLNTSGSEIVFRIVDPDLNVDFVTLEGNYLYFTKPNEIGLYRMSIDGSEPFQLLDFYDRGTMTLNIYKNALYVSRNIDGDMVTEIYDKNGSFISQIDDFLGNIITSKIIYSND